MCRNPRKRAENPACGGPGSRECPMSLGSEAGAVQNPFVKYAQQAGWVYLSPDDARSLRRGADTSPVLDEVLIDQLQKLNPGVVDRDRAEELVGRLVRVRTTIEGFHFPVPWCCVVSRPPVPARRSRTAGGCGRKRPPSRTSGCPGRGRKERAGPRPAATNR